MAVPSKMAVAPTSPDASGSVANMCDTDVGSATASNVEADTSDMADIMTGNTSCMEDDLKFKPDNRADKEQLNMTEKGDVKSEMAEKMAAKSKMEMLRHIVMLVFLRAAMALAHSRQINFKVL